MHDVVAVGDGDPGAAGGVQGAVAGGGRPLVGMLDQDVDPRVGPRQRLGDVGAVIGGGVIDQDQLPVGQGLALKRSDGLSQMARAVVVGHHHRNAGDQAHWPPPGANTAA